MSKYALVDYVKSFLSKSCTVARFQAIAENGCKICRFGSFEIKESPIKLPELFSQLRREGIHVKSDKEAEAFVIWNDQQGSPPPVIC